MNKLIASLILVASIASAAEQPSAPVGNQSSVPPGVSVEPPQGSFGVKACSAEGKPTLVVWVILKNGKVIRMDKDHHPKTPEDMQAFLAWLDTGPSDIIEIKCPVST